MARSSVQCILGNARKSRYVALFFVGALYALYFYLNNHLFNTELPLPKLRQDTGRPKETFRGGVPEHDRPLSYEIQDPDLEVLPQAPDATAVHVKDPVRLPSIDEPATND